MPLEWSIPVPSFSWIRLTAPALWRLQFSIDRQLKIRIFTFFGDKGGQISNFIFLSPKGTTLAWKTHNDILNVRVRPNVGPVAVAKEEKKDRNFYASNWLFVQTTHVDGAPGILHAGSCLGISYIFKGSWKSVRGSPTCGGRKLPSPIDKAHGLYNSLYTSCDELSRVFHA